MLSGQWGDNSGIPSAVAAANALWRKFGAIFLHRRGSTPLLFAAVPGTVAGVLGCDQEEVTFTSGAPKAITWPFSVPLGQKAARANRIMPPPLSIPRYRRGREAGNRGL